MSRMVFNNTQEMLKYTKKITEQSLKFLGEDLQNEFADEACDNGFSREGVASPYAYDVKIESVPRLAIEVKYKEDNVPLHGRDEAYGGTGWYEDSWNLGVSAWHHTSPSNKPKSQPENLLSILQSKDVGGLIAENEKPGIWGTARVFAHQNGTSADPDFFDRLASDRPRLRKLCRKSLLMSSLPIE